MDDNVGKPAPEVDERDVAEIAALAIKLEHARSMGQKMLEETRASVAGADVTRDCATEQPAEKSEGQLVLERLLAVSAHMSIVGGQLDSLKHAIGLPVAGCGGAPAGNREVSQFLPALRCSPTGWKSSSPASTDPSTTSRRRFEPCRADGSRLRHFVAARNRCE